MGNKLTRVDDHCQQIYDEYHECWKKWKEETDIRQWYHEGASRECDRILADFNFCVKEQLGRITNTAPPQHIQKVRDNVKQDQQKEQPLQNQSSNTNIDNNESHSGHNIVNLTQTSQHAA